MDRRNFKEKKLWYLLDNKLRRQKRKKRVNNQWANFIPGNTRHRIERGDFSIKKLDEKNTLISEFNKEKILHISMDDIEHLCDNEHLKIVNLNEVSWYGKHKPLDERRENCVCCNGEKYKKCDIKYEPIVIEDSINNPLETKYFAMDGRHRFEKMEAQEIHSCRAFVLKYQEIEKYLRAEVVTVERKKLEFVDKVYIFDVDGTLTPSRLPMTKEFEKFFGKWAEKNWYWLVTGSDLPKLQEQLPEYIIQKSQGFFTCCGNEFYGPSLSKHRKKHNFKYSKEFHVSDDLLEYLQNTLDNSDYPIKAGNHIEDRGALLNFSIVGRDCTQEQREEYYKWDKKNNNRKSIANYIEKKWPHLEAVLGGQISIDIYPKGNDKSQVFQEIKEWPRLQERYHVIKNYIFIGDRTEEGGNDYPLAKLMEKTDRCSYHQTKGWEHTKQILEELND